MEKNIQKIKIKNQLELWAFCAVIGTVAGALVWALLKIMASGTEMIWEWIPERIHIPYYTVLVCTVGGAIIGIFRKLYGDYPEDMETVALPENPPRPPKSVWSTIYIGKGKKEKLSKMDIAGFLYKKGNLTREDVGAIDVKEH